MDAVTTVPEPANEPVRTYAPGTPERASLLARLRELRGEHVELTQTIGGRRRMAAGERFAVVEPHRHASVLGTSANATDADVADAQLIEPGQQRGALGGAGGVGADRLVLRLGNDRDGVHGDVLSRRCGQRLSSERWKKVRFAGRSARRRVK